MPTYTVHTFLTHCFVPTALQIGANITVEPLPGLPATEVAELIASYVRTAVGQNPMRDDVRANVANRIADGDASVVVTVSGVPGDDRRAAIEKTQDTVVAIRDTLALRQLHRGHIAGFLVIQTDGDPPELYAEVRPRNVDMRRVYNLDDPSGEGALIDRVVTTALAKPKLRQYLSLYADAVSSTDTVVSTITREARLLKLWILLEVMAEQGPETRTVNGRTTTGKRAKVENLYDRYNLSVHPEYQGVAGKHLLEMAYALRNAVAHSGGCDAATDKRSRNACRAYGHLLPEIVEDLAHDARFLINHVRP